MVAVLMTPPYLQFFDDEGVPLSGGKVYTYTATGTFTTPKATYTTAAGDTEADNPVILDAAGRPQSGGGSIWLSGTYDFKVTDSLDNTIETTLNVTAFNTLPSQSNAYFQSFSGNGSQTAFTTSSDLGTDEKAIYVWVDAGLMDHVGYQIQNPSAYTISGTTLTFGSPPAAGTGNIYVSAPSLLVGAASSSAADAAASAAAAMASAIAAATSETNAGNSATAAAGSATAAASSASNAAISSQWATLTTGLVDGTDYSSKAWAIGGTGTATNSSKYWAGQAAALVLGNILNLAQQSVTPGTPTAGNSKLYFKTDGLLYQLNPAGTESAVGGLTPLATRTASVSSTLSFTSLITTQFDIYYFIFKELLTSTTCTINMLASINNGSTYPVNFATQKQQIQLGSNSAPVYTGVSNATPALLTTSQNGSSFSGNVYLVNPLSSFSGATSANFESNLSSTIMGYDVVYGQFYSPAVNAIRFAPSAGSFTSGEIRMYGMIK